jgi:hypothetical protein
MRRTLVVVSALVLFAAACSGEGTPQGEREQTAQREQSVPGLRDETLLLDTPAGPLAVRAPGGSVLSAFPDALAAGDGSLVYSARVEGGTTVLDSVAPATGEVAAHAEIRGGYRLGVVSGSGRAAALTERLPDGWDPWTPLPRATTEIVVADPTGSSEPREFTLKGNFEPEAFSVDDRTLFLIQHLPALRPEAYRVTTLDLRSGEVRPTYGPFKTPSERMPGIRLQQLWGPNGNQLYTLYSSARPGYAPHRAPVASDAAVSFVHVLDLEERWAHCVGLPEAMSASPDGSRLFVVDAGLGLVAVMDTETLQVRTGAVALASSGDIGRTTARTSADGRTLFVSTSASGSSEIAKVNVGTFEVVDRWRLTGAVSTLGLSADGERLYAATGTGVVVLDTETGRRLIVVPIETPAAVTEVLPIAA